MLSARKRSKGEGGCQAQDSQAISHNAVEAIRENEYITAGFNRGLMHTRRATPTCQSKYKGTWDVDTVQQIGPKGYKLGKNRMWCETGPPRRAQPFSSVRVGTAPTRTPIRCARRGVPDSHNNAFRRVFHVFEFSSWTPSVPRPCPLCVQAWSSLCPGCGPLCARQAWTTLGPTAFVCQPKCFN